MTNGEVWNALAKEYGNQYHALTDWRLGYSIVEELLGKIKGKRILDYGCGPGKFSRRLRDLGASVTAVDSSANAIHNAQQKDKRAIDYRVVEEDNLSFVGNASIDSAVANFVFCTMQSGAQVRNIAQHIYTKLNPGGRLVILEPHPDSLGYEYISMKREKPKELKTGTPITVHLTGMETPFYDYWRSKDDYLQLFEDVGFKIDTMREPRIEDSLNEHFWKDERIQPPSLIMRFKKSLYP